MTTFTADVYKLCCKDTNVLDIYVGSTRSFRQRKSCHKQKCSNPSSIHHNLYVYQIMRQNGGFDNWDMISLYNGQFESKREL